MTEVLCSNCGARLNERYCGQCGQKRAERLTFAQLARALTSQLLQLDFASLRTAAQLTLGPGRVARAYVKGQRRTYVNPLKYAFLTATAYVLVINLFKVQIVPPAGPFQLEPKRFLLYLSSLPYLTLPLLVPVAALQRFLFRDSEFNVMECYVLQIYVHGHLFLIHTICAALGAYGSSIAYVVLLQLISILLLVWGLESFHGTPWVSTVLKALILALASRLLFACVGLAFQWPRSA